MPPHPAVTQQQARAAAASSSAARPPTARPPTARWSARTPWRESAPPPQFLARMSTMRRPRAAASAITWSRALRATSLYTPAAGVGGCSGAVVGQVAPREWVRRGRGAGAGTSKRPARAPPGPAQDLPSCPATAHFTTHPPGPGQASRGWCRWLRRAREGRAHRRIDSEPCAAAQDPSRPRARSRLHTHAPKTRSTVMFRAAALSSSVVAGFLPLI